MDAREAWASRVAGDILPIGYRYYSTVHLSNLANEQRLLLSRVGEIDRQLEQLAVDEEQAENRNGTDDSLHDQGQQPEQAADPTVAGENAAAGVGPAV